MSFSYVISSVNEYDRWLLISSNDDDINDTDSFVFLLKSIAAQTNGKICEVGDFQYAIDNDLLNLKYQWDSLFGITVMYPEMVSSEQVRSFLENLPWFRKKSPGS